LPSLGTTTKQQVATVRGMARSPIQRIGIA
jgi:hypothetical protein